MSSHTINNSINSQIRKELEKYEEERPIREHQKSCRFWHISKQGCIIVPGKCSKRTIYECGECKYMEMRK